MKNTKNIGDITEDIAAGFLEKQGLTLVAKNFHCRQGELDLIMQDGNTWVFIEVKYRRSAQFGGAISAISPSKQKKIKHCVTFYLQQQGLNEYNTACRIDAVALQGSIEQPEITWIKNAF
ncbi:YraN family protein [Colwellia sp. RSH04]|uniref:YraN family protein n=1 Tax=Colwellia sp. RSH04 TaxID=2305464 RepID=UPI000E576FE9|nr:YraN family protein [Colwellia sp. RSH04]RHW76689.1 YraN family protein [Colwellia sp. RSH04]